MPRQSQRLLKKDLDLSDDDDDHGGRPSQKSKKNKKGPAPKEDGLKAQSEEISAEIQKHKVDDVIRYCLACNQNQKPVQRADIVRNCLGKEYSNLFNDVFAEVRSKMRSIFGIEVLESDEKRGFYYLSNTLPRTDFLSTNKEQSITDALLYSILSNIYMRDPKEKLVDDQCFNVFLSKLGLKLDEKHQVFGDVKKLIYKTFVEQGWLEIFQQTGENASGELFGWGYRAKLVLNRGDMLNFVAEVLFNDGEKASVWIDHQHIAAEEDQDGE